MDDRDSWTPPEPLAARPGVRGALGGSRLFDQPAQRAEVERFRAFVAGDCSLAVEIGFDHGYRLLDNATRNSDVRWLGLEVRKARVLELAPRAPDNLLVWRADARTIFARLVPPSRVSRVDIFFPTPWWDENKRARRLLMTPEFVADLGAAMAPGGVVQLATDVGPYFAHVESLFVDWSPAEPPKTGEARSRRERVCERDGLTVWRGCWTPST